MRKAIALAVDANYLDKALVTIKSVCVYNRDVDFYLFNQDTPVEWIRSVNKKLAPLGSTLTNVKVYSQDIAHLITFLSVSSWFRLFLADAIPASRAVYLDSDMLINTSLDYLFNLDLEGNYLAAVMDPHKNEAGGFNTGMLVADLDLWRSENMTETLLKTADENYKFVKNGDQSIINIVFKDRWLKLNKTWNFQTYDVVSRYDHRAYLYLDIADHIPNIVHFLTSDKPWNENSVARFRELWWYYFQLDFSELTGQRKTPVTYKEAMSVLSVSDLHVFTLTSTDQLEAIEDLIQFCPDVQFHIGAYTVVSERLSKLEQYPNVMIYPELINARIRQLIQLSSAYLDINHGPEADDVLQKVKEANRPIFAFENTSHDKNSAAQLFPATEVNRMVAAIQDFSLNNL
ncbi:glycosyltransferase family 8 protein [Streptococcus loxodontisalivarius]|uniref:Lipopolysaccharide biosynthesis glycosyltransferase n=1 Tax=Streptococcus loxodontisalivarius TaxID=1349415 RepID=A0ABS2PSM4_9STRE|nr:glycosyltransferase family 8 protein [Streptococcus loxodontisalivarius]MBM7642926.1 lipopolysaccharide biosynthesis glycosyltransferase [Streptococcus loxodontisalivarius]